MKISAGSVCRQGFLLVAMGLILAFWASAPLPSYGAEKEENEQKVTLDQTPAAVQETIKREIAGGTLQEIEKEIEDGKTVYEAEFTKDGKEFELTIAGDGKMLGLEEEEKDEDDEDDEDQDEAEENEQKVTLDQTPVAVQETIKSETAGGTLQEIEKEIEDGKTVFEAEFTKDGKEFELTIAEDGKMLGIEEEGKDEEEENDKENEKDHDADEEEDDSDELEVTFEDTAVGEVPKGCLISETHGQGKKATWKVLEMEGAPSGKKVFALAETANSADTINLAIAKDIKAKNLELSVELKPISGSFNQGGGLLWRAKDANNYYFCLWDAVKGELSVGLERDGNLAQLKSVKVNADPQAWHEIGIKMRGSKIKAEFDDKTVIEVKEDHLQAEGNVGVLTQGDAATAFDNFEVGEVEKEGYTRKDKE